jgi:hypothetical protein
MREPAAEAPRALFMTRRPFLVAALAAGLAAAGCGGASQSAGDGPATAVPANAAVYFEATVRPQGRLREDALAAAAKLLDSRDPEGQIFDLVAKGVASAEEAQLDYARDIDPWLGDRIAFWASGREATSSSSEKAAGLALAATTDPDLARERIAAALKRAGEHTTPRSYEGVDYDVGRDGMAWGIVGNFAAFGNEADLKASIRAAGGDSLAEDDRYGDSFDGLPEERLAQFFVDPKVLFAGALQKDPELRQQLEAFRRFFPVDQLGPVAGTLTADGDRLAMDTAMTGRSSELLRSLGVLGGAASTPLVGELPGDSFGAYGIPDLGATARALYDKLAGALGGAAISQQLKQETGLDLEQDLFSWIGDTAFFIRGASVDALDGGAVIEVTDAGRATAAFGKIVGAIRASGSAEPKPVRIAGAETAFAFAEPGAKKPVVLARGADRVVVAYGEEAAAAALSGDAKLAEAGTYGDAKAVLGGDYEPSFLLSLPQVLSLVEAAGEADADFATAKRYLDALTVVAGGGETTDERSVSRLVVGLK